MKVQYFGLLLIIVLFVFFVSCNDHIFYDISIEPEPTSPMVQGTPSGFAVFGNYIYVANGQALFRYSGNDGSWSRDSSFQPPGRVHQLASTENHLYALTFSNANMVAGTETVRRFNGSSWDETPVFATDNNDNRRIYNIFAANNTLFIIASAGSHDDSSVFFVNSSGVTEQLMDNTGERVRGNVRGVAHNGLYYVIATRNNGIFTTDLSAGGTAHIENSHAFTGIINLGDDANTIILAVRNGRLFRYPNLDDHAARLPGNRRANGALAVWVNQMEWPDRQNERLLLVGRQDETGTMASGFSHGYMEIAFSAENGDFIDINTNDSRELFAEPGLRERAFSSIRLDSVSVFRSTLGRHPIQAIIQVPPGFYSMEEAPDPIPIFASTLRNGLFSYRIHAVHRDSHWNAEAAR